MSNYLDFEGFLETKNRERAFFVCLMDGEKPYLENSTHWMHHSPFKIHLVRMSKDEFNMLHIGVHPKVILYDKGREINTWNGIPDYETLLEES